MAGRCLFLTGSTGFIGRRVLHRIGVGGDSIREVRCLTRRPDGLLRPDLSHRVTLVRGRLEEPDSYDRALEGVDTVVHLAAVTGRAPKADYFRVNTEGTRRLLGACRRAGTERFLYVSSVAARFANATAYHYGASKSQAEQLVRESALPYAIVRPTIVLGPGSPIGRLLIALGSRPVVVLPGTGRCRVQPIFVDDLADCLLALVGRGFSRDEIEIGGPEVSTLDQLIQRVRMRAGKSRPWIVHVPLRPAVVLLAQLEAFRLPLPITAGQLSVFANDASAHSNRFHEERRGTMTGIDAMLGLQDAHA